MEQGRASALMRPLQAVVAACVLLAGLVQSGDEDQDPPYMIYIDPETGRYMTTDPGVQKARLNEKRERVQMAERRSRTGSLQTLAIAVGAIITVLVLAYRYRRRNHTLRQTVMKKSI